MGKQEYPYQNVSLKNIKGERWKDIPGFEDEYQLSDYGRLKSQARWVDHGTYDHFFPEKIRKLRLSRTSKNKNQVDLQMGLHKHGKRYSFSVGRYVYWLFVRSFDIEDHSVIITRKDGNGLNCYYKNLALRSISDVAKEGYTTKNRTSPFQLQSKPVTQYDPHGKMIAAFRDAKQAAAATGLSSNYICDAARTQERMSGGFYWRYGKPKPQIDILKFKKFLDLPSEVGLDFPGHHYLNRGIKNIRNEKWKTIGDFAGLYEISDHGRIKSLRSLKQVVSVKGNITQSWTTEFIMKQALGKASNNYIAKPLYYLTIRLQREKNYSTHIVARLVYETFGKDKEALVAKVIAHKDNDNLNNHISNLTPSTLTEIYKTSFVNNRRISHFTNLAKKQRHKYVLLAIEKNKIPVIQYNSLGKRITLFDSIVSAANATGARSSCISNALAGRIRTAGGFIWKKATAIDIKKASKHV